MDKMIRFGESSSVQYGLGKYPLENSLSTPGNGRGAQSSAKVLRLVMTPAEGYELLRKLRGDPLTDNVPNIVLTR